MLTSVETFVIIHGTLRYYHEKLTEKLKNFVIEMIKEECFCYNSVDIEVEERDTFSLMKF